MLGLLLLGALCLGLPSAGAPDPPGARAAGDARRHPLPGATHVPGEDGWALVLGAESQALLLAELERSRGKTQASAAGGSEPRGRGPPSPTAPDSPAPSRSSGRTTPSPPSHPQGASRGDPRPDLHRRVRDPTEWAARGRRPLQRPERPRADPRGPGARPTGPRAPRGTALTIERGRRVPRPADSPARRGSDPVSTRGHRPPSGPVRSRRSRHEWAERASPIARRLEPREGLAGDAAPEGRIQTNLQLVLLSLLEPLLAQQGTTGTQLAQGPAIGCRDADEEPSPRASSWVATRASSRSRPCPVLALRSRTSPSNSWARR